MTVFPHTALSVIHAGATDDSPLIATNGIINQSHLPVGSDSTLGLLKNGDMAHLTIVNGGIQVLVVTDIGAASTDADKAKLPTAGAVQNYISSSGVVPISAVNGLTTSLTTMSSRIEDLAGALHYLPISFADVGSTNSTAAVALSDLSAFGPGGIQVTPVETAIT